jgi:hypothetical protein
MRRTAWCVLIILSLFVVSTVAAQSGGDYDLSWSAIDGGGGTSSGGPYTMNGTIGQPDAGVMLGGDYTLDGGISPGETVIYRVFLPIVIR